MRTLRISLTDQCNYNCSFCHNEGLEKNFCDNLITPEIIEKLAKIANQAKINKITLTGGEPLLNKNREDIIQTLYNNKGNLTLSIATNLVLADECSISLIAQKFNQVNVNFQADNDFDFKNMSSGNLAMVKEKLKFLKNSGKCAIVLNYVYTKLNSHNLPGIISYAQENNFEIKILELVKDSANTHIYSDISGAKQIISSLGYKTKKFHGNDEYLGNYKEKHNVRIIHSYCNTSNIKHCFLLGEVRLSPDLVLHPCIKSNINSLDVKDNIINDSIEKNSEIFARLFTKEVKNCDVCDIFKSKYKVNTR